jgi:uncharacterized OsmC-like protein
MQKRIFPNQLVILVPMLLILLLSCTLPTEPEPASELEPVAEVSQLATASVAAKLPAQDNRVTVIGHKDLQYFVDAEPTTDGLQENDTLLAAITTCGIFVAEKAAQELDIPLTGATATSIFNENERRVQVYLDLPGADGDQVIDLANHFKQRCPIYTTLSEAKSVEFTPGEQLETVADDSTVVTATLFRFGGANVTAGENSFVMDSVPPLDGPNNELNPLDMMLGGLAACSSFVYQSQVPEADVSVVVEGDFDPSGVRDLDGPNPRIQTIRIILQGDDIEEAQAGIVEEQIEERCDLYAILKGTVNIEVSTEPIES